MRVLLVMVLFLPSSRFALAAESCVPARAMIVLDKSSSMETGTIGDTPKWEIAVDALLEVVSRYDGSIAFGLMLFPDPGQCSAGSVQVNPALGMRSQIHDALGEPPPSAGNWTPMSQTLDAVVALPFASERNGQRYVVLITDGWQWCSPYESNSRFDPVASVRNLAAVGVGTYVVGFGDQVDALALNQMAVVGGMAPSGCNSTGEQPNSPAPCYLRADDPDSLSSALQAITLQVSTEVCDGADNDCDGEIDEECECTPGQMRACREDACEPGQQECLPDGTWNDCEAFRAATPEVCDGEDNDCNGTSDDDADGTLCPDDGMCLGGVCVYPPDHP